MRSLFIFNPADLNSNPPGGVQLCSQEFLAFVTAASDVVMQFPVQVRHQLAARALRRVGAAPYRAYVPEDHAAALKEAILREKISHVFINKSELMRFSAVICQLDYPVKIILMSHGNQSGDDLYDIAGPYSTASGLQKYKEALGLGLNLVTESEYRHRFIDGVCVMSEEERTLEHWLGARATIFLPRLLNGNFVEWKPVNGRVGYAGTLNHPPNRRALEMIFQELSERNAKIEIRLIGKPEEQGHEFVRCYPFVNYLGPLSEPELRVEAVSWCAFLNPIFGLARGASMKLAAGLNLGLPVVSTKFGARGYDFGEVDYPVTENTPKTFVDAVLEIAKSQSKWEAAAELTRKAVLSAPTVQQVGKRLRKFASDF